MKEKTLFLLRLSIAYLMLIWGVDKVVNPEHAVAVSDGFYLGLFSSAALLQAFGVLQMAAGLAFAAGLGRRWLYPLMAAIAGATLLGVWRSVVDPWGWYLEGANALFYPSAVIFAAVLVLWAFRDEDRIAVDARARTAGAGADARTLAAG